MLRMESTEHNAGIRLAGDYNELEHLYEALHAVVGTEFEYDDYEASRLRVLGVCYDLRHAMMGDRGAVALPNGYSRDIGKFLNTIGPDKNMYFTCEVLWPEAIFIMFTLDDFIRLYEKKMKTHVWDSTVMTVRLFQSAIAKCFEETVPENKFKNAKRYFKSYAPGKYNRFTTMYVDDLNITHLEMTPERRVNQLSILVKRLADFPDDYYHLHHHVMASAKKLNCHPTDLRYSREYPEDWEW
ncbi:hypothetical protein MKY84_04965 [Chryseomicrobium sp. FSL W7-1435]|uniref:DUF6904 family protein n=1 Tax=Chryseomicrobium sp. FSL W7-1435 TaxID=2921704 RepID=UPI00315AA64F